MKKHHLSCINRFAKGVRGGVDISVTSTLSSACFDGVIILKEQLAAEAQPLIAARKRAERMASRDEYHASPKILAAVMRYKE